MWPRHSLLRQHRHWQHGLAAGIWPGSRQNNHLALLWTEFLGKGRDVMLMQVMGLGNVKDNASNISRDQNRRNTTEKIKNYYKCAAISHLTDEGSSPALYPVLRDTYTYPLTVLLKESFKQTSLCKEDSVLDQQIQHNWRNLLIITVHKTAKNTLAYIIPTIDEFTDSSISFKTIKFLKFQIEALEMCCRNTKEQMRIDDVVFCRTHKDG